jgi:hypothetical protein
VTRPLLTQRRVVAETERTDFSMKTSSTDQATEAGRLEAGEPFQGTFAQLCHWAYAVHFEHLRDAKGDLCRIRQHAGDPDASPPRLTWLGALDAHQVTTAELEKYLAELAKTRTERGTLMSSGTINRVRKMFSGVFRLAIQHGIWSGENPATKGLASHEIAPVLAAAKDWRGVFAVGLLMGLRRGEIFALRKADVDLERRVLSVGSTARPIPEQLVPHLETALDKLLDKPGRALLFPDGRGNKRSGHTDLASVLRSAMVRAGIIAHYDHKCRGKGCGHVEQHYDSGDRCCPKCNKRLSPYGQARKISFDVACRAARATDRVQVARVSTLTGAPIADAITFTSLNDAIRALDTATAMIAACMTELSPARRKALKGAFASCPEYKRSIEWGIAKGGLDRREVSRQLTIYADESRLASVRSVSQYDTLKASIEYRDGDLVYPTIEQRAAEIALLARLLIDVEEGPLEGIERWLLEMLFEQRPAPPRHLRVA